MCSTRRSANNTITPEQWQTHFEQLFCSELDLDDTNAVVQNLDNADLDDLEQCIFNSEITKL